MLAKKTLSFCFGLLFVLMLTAQNKYVFWVELVAKDSVPYFENNPKLYLSEAAIQRRSNQQLSIVYSDIPITRKYADSLSLNGYRVLGASKWMNALMVVCQTPKALDSLKQFTFVKEVRFLGKQHDISRPKREVLPSIEQQILQLDNKVTGRTRRIDTGFYGNATMQVSQLKLDSIHKLGFMGKGITIAVLDAGFKNANLLHMGIGMFKKAEIRIAKDFVALGNSGYNADEHGLSVFSTMSAYVPGYIVGTSPEASYLLLRSEDAEHETLIEEALWVIAAEFADSAGADIIHSSLGYNVFDEIKMNHGFKELNGRTALISIGAQMAVEKGLIVVNSAGNEGDKEWRYITVPADAPGVITVGGVDHEGNTAMFSSQGLTADKRIKPDVVAMGEGTYVISSTGLIHPANGTSYSAPLVSGMIACLLQANPQSTPEKMLASLQLSGSNYFKPNKYIGYGIPDAILVNEFLKNDSSNAVARILDFRLLKDHKFHLATKILIPQTFTIIITDEAGNVLTKQYKKISTAGNHRFDIGKIKKMKKGVTYTVKLIWKEGQSSVNYHHESL
jgi:hypothetical protein